MIPVKIKNLSETVKKKLKEYPKEYIIFTKHALNRIEIRKLDKKQIINELTNPEKLKVAILKDKIKDEYDLLFIKSKRKGSRYFISFTPDTIRIISAMTLGKSTMKYIKKHNIDI